MHRKKDKQADVMDKDTAGREVSIPSTEQFLIRSKENRQYKILLGISDVPPPPSGFPVIYFLDANAIFGTMFEAVRIQSRRPERTGIVPALVVGIGYHIEKPFSPERYYDFTLTPPASELYSRREGTDRPEYGGAEQFLQFIDGELKPLIESRFKIDKDRQAIFGHSLGGLFVLQTLFTKPYAFNTYIAGSPSIHWNKSLLLDAEQKFISSLENDKHHIRLLITVGELEKFHKSGMNANAKELAERLLRLDQNNFHVEFKEFEDEGHVSVLPALINRAVRFALSEKQGT